MCIRDRGSPCGPDQLGVQNIHQRVDNANLILQPALDDTTAILGGLVSVNGHLTSICNAGAIKLLTGPTSC